ncbi:unnamed protein product, partial [Rotaria magnacalcarata]
KIGLVLAWVILLTLAYRVSLIETEHKEYDPFAMLGIDREATLPEIKRAYRDLSKKHHPDRGGDAEMFVSEITEKQVLEKNNNFHFLERNS